MSGRAAVLLSILACALGAQDYPRAGISNGIITAGVYLPDPEKGSYRGTRFDWSGIIYSLEYKGHQYFGAWYRKHDPLIHDAVTGPAESFDTDGAGPGFAEARPGELFLRVGVGHVERPDDQPFNPFRTYKVVDPGKWKVSTGRNWIEFVHTVSDRIGYAYVYTKRITLVPGQPVMIIDHALRNTGKRVIRTTQYNHNFFVIDNQPSGPGWRVVFPFNVKALKDMRGMVEARGRELVFLQEFRGNQSVQSLLEGFSDKASDYDIVVENTKAGAGVRITGNRPIVRLNFWTRRETVCPEPYIALEVVPGATERWQYRYRFYTLEEPH